MASCLICGCVKNCEIYLDNVFKNIEKIQKIFIKSKIIISFDISNDFTLKKLIELKQKAIIFISHDRVLNKKICKNGAVLKNGVLSNTMRINDAYDFYDQA